MLSTRLTDWFVHFSQNTKNSLSSSLPLFLSFRSSTRVHIYSNSNVREHVLIANFKNSDKQIRLAWIRVVPSMSNFHPIFELLGRVSSLTYWETHVQTHTHTRISGKLKELALELASQRQIVHLTECDSRCTLRLSSVHIQDCMCCMFD